MNQKAFNYVVGRKTAIVKDTDKDGVWDSLDCSPRNPNKQGVVENIKKRLEERKNEKLQARAANQQIRKKEQAAYYQAKEKESIKLGQQRASYEREQKIKQIRSGGGGGFVGAVSSFASAFGSNKQTAQRTAAPQRRKVTRYVKTKGGKYKKQVSYKTTKPKQAPAQQPRQLTPLSSAPKFGNAKLW